MHECAAGDRAGNPSLIDSRSARGCKEREGGGNSFGLGKSGCLWWGRKGKNFRELMVWYIYIGGWIK